MLIYAWNLSLDVITFTSRKKEKERNDPLKNREDSDPIYLYRETSEVKATPLSHRYKHKKPLLLKATA